MIRARNSARRICAISTSINRLRSSRRRLRCVWRTVAYCVVPEKQVIYAVGEQRNFLAKLAPEAAIPISVSGSLSMKRSIRPGSSSDWANSLLLYAMVEAKPRRPKTIDVISLVQPFWYYVTTPSSQLSRTVFGHCAAPNQFDFDRAGRQIPRGFFN